MFAVGDGTTTIFQIKRPIITGGIAFSEPVFAFNGNPVITVDGAETAVTVLDLGKVQFATAPANGARLNWTGQFYYRCRFEIDELDISKLMSGLWEGRGIDFRSFKQ
jgi:hypothetical protein